MEVSNVQRVDPYQIKTTSPKQVINDEPKCHTHASLGFQPQHRSCPSLILPLFYHHHYPY